MAIVLSYSRKDERVVKALVQGLEGAKREVWFDHNLGGGDAWWDAILENIRSATVFLFALSDASLHSKPCRLELDYALDLGRPIVPVQVGPVTSFRTNPLAALQIIGYSPDNVQSGFTIVAAIDDAAKRQRPLPDPLPPEPPIPFAYLLALGRQIDSAELSLTDQVAVVDQLRRALGEETDESVRQDILSMLQNLNTKPWTAKRTEREIAALLYAHAPVPLPGEEHRTVSPGPPDTAEPATPAGVAGTAAAGPPDTAGQTGPAGTPAASPPQRPEPDPRDWFAERLEQLQKQRAAEDDAARANPRPWRLPSDAAAQWSRRFGRDTPGWPGAGEPPSPGGPDPTPPPAPGLTPQTMPSQYGTPTPQHPSPPEFAAPQHPTSPGLAGPPRRSAATARAWRNVGIIAGGVLLLVLLIVLSSYK